MIISGVVLFRFQNQHQEWLLVKKAGGDWEIPKFEAKKTESSVRAVLRSLFEEHGIQSRVLEEVSRTTTTAKVKGETVSRKIIFYLAKKSLEDGNINKETQIKWFPYGLAKRNVKLSREKKVLMEANKLLKTLLKNRLNNW